MPDEPESHMVGEQEVHMMTVRKCLARSREWHAAMNHVIIILADGHLKISCLHGILLKVLVSDEMSKHTGWLAVSQIMNCAVIIGPHIILDYVVITSEDE